MVTWTTRTWTNPKGGLVEGFELVGWCTSPRHKWLLACWQIAPSLSAKSFLNIQYSMLIHQLTFLNPVPPLVYHQFTEATLRRKKEGACAHNYISLPCTRTTNAIEDSCKGLHGPRGKNFITAMAGSLMASWIGVTSVDFAQASDGKRDAERIFGLSKVDMFLAVSS